ncbi:response regulator transcription factor [Candidatus Latescibacterota bacterium]
MAEKRKIRVGIADDEIHIRMLMKKVFQSMNCDIAGEAKNGTEAVDLYKREQPEMMFLDINMPIKTGIDALKEIISEFPDAFVVMLTSVSDMESIEECIEAGAANYIRKDTPISELKEIVKETWGMMKKRGSDA